MTLSRLTRFCQPLRVSGLVPTPEPAQFPGVTLSEKSYGVASEELELSTRPQIVQRTAATTRVCLPDVKSWNFNGLCKILRDRDLSSTILPGRIEFDEMSLRVTLGRQPLTDVDVDRIIERIGDVFCSKSSDDGLQFTPEAMHRALNLIAQDSRYHPVREYLSALKWDGSERLSVLPRWLKVEPDAFGDKLIRYWMIAAVARAFEPGCQVDQVLILYSTQGDGKSSVLRALVPVDAWFTNSKIDLRNKDAMGTLRTTWIYEFKELSSFKGADSETIKGFIDQRVDKWRPPYARTDIVHPRGCVFVGSVNPNDFLSDPTGSRRFWTMVVTAPIDINVIAGQRDQLWAEAVAAYRAGEPWYPPPEERSLLTLRNRRFEEEDPWESVILRFLRRRLADTSLSSDCRVTSADVLTAIGVEQKEAHAKHVHRIAGILRKLGCKDGKVKGGGRYWRVPFHLAAEIADSLG